MRFAPHRKFVRAASNYVVELSRTTSLTRRLPFTTRLGDDASSKAQRAGDCYILIAAISRVCVEVATCRDWLSTLSTSALPGSRAGSAAEGCAIRPTGRVLGAPSNHRQPLRGEFLLLILQSRGGGNPRRAKKLHIDGDTGIRSVWSEAVLTTENLPRKTRIRASPCVRSQVLATSCRINVCDGHTLRNVSLGSDSYS